MESFISERVSARENCSNRSSSVVIAKRRDHDSLPRGGGREEAVQHLAQRQEGDGVIKRVEGLAGDIVLVRRDGEADGGVQVVEAVVGHNVRRHVEQRVRVRVGAELAEGAVAVARLQRGNDDGVVGRLLPPRLEGFQLWLRHQ